MLHENLEIKYKEHTASLYTYILDNSPKIDIERKRPMVVICPGGGYEYTSDREAEPIAIQLLSMGFHACVLRYSCRPAVFPTALCQLAIAVKTIRERAKEWNVDPTKIIVLGFSAGGHLAASLGVFWNNKFLLELLDFNNEQIRPNGIILSYPVISSGTFAHKGSFDALLGCQQENQQLRELLSLEKQVSTNTPPTFLWHTTTDTAVPVENSMLFAQSLLQNKISLELHIYPNGVHGLSLGTEETKTINNESLLQKDVSNWIEMAGRWIKGLA